MSMSKPLLERQSGSRETVKDDLAGPVIVRDGRARMRLLIASAGMLVLGLALFYASYADGLGSTGSLFLAIAGIVVVITSLLLYLLSPARFLRNDVTDAMCLSGTEFMYRTLMPLAARSPAYVPPGVNGDSRTLLLVSEGGGLDPALCGMGVQVRGMNEKNIFVVPPGYGLMEHAKRLGATFTAEGLEEEMRDTLVNGFELAGNVRVEQGNDRVTVELRNVASATMCATLRKRNPGICTSIGCPLCSFVGCMVAEGTGRKIVPGEVSARGKNIRLSFGLT